MNQKRFMLLIGLLVTFSMVLSACGPTATPTTAPTAAAAAPATGGPDSVVFTAIADAPSAVAQLQAGAIDMYPATGGNADVFKTVKADSNLTYINTYGSNDQLLFNPVDYTADGILNPFSDMKIREAMNWLVDRNYASQEITGGLAVPKYTALDTAFPDAARFAGELGALATKYAYNFDKAQQVVDTEMTAMGATKDAAGKYQYKGKPVSIIGLIRTEDERKQIGEYFANQLEKLGFTVDRQEKVRKEAAPIWQGDVTKYTFGFYTAGWINTAIVRDEGFDFAQFNSGDVQNIPVFLKYQPSAELKAAEDALLNNTFKTMDERASLFKTALNDSMTESWWGVWVLDKLAFEPYSAKVAAAGDLAAGFGNVLFPYTAGFTGQTGGSLRIAQSGVLVQAWNPVQGSNWTDDQIAESFTEDHGAVPNPYTGLMIPKLISKMDVVAKSGLPITKTLDWVGLTSQDSIAVPDDAWADWDATSQTFITAKDRAANVAKAKQIVEQVDTQAKTAAGAVGFKTFDDKALAKFLTDLGTFYNTQTGKNAVDVATAVGTDDNKKALADEVAKIKGLASDADRQAELVTFAEGFVKGLDSTTTFATADGNYAQTANVQVTVTFNPDLLKSKWHDGSTMSAADFVMGMIMTFDPGKKESKIYDEGYATTTLDAFLPHFKGVKIVSTDPMTITTWDDKYQLDAENMVISWYPSYGGNGDGDAYFYGTTAWHNLTPGIQAEADGKMAFSLDKSSSLKVDETSQVSGPTLGIQSQYLDQDATAGYIPFAPTLGTYITADEAKARYANLQAFYKAHNNMWLGTGPYFVDKVDPTAGSITMSRFKDYMFQSDQFAGFTKPEIAVASVDGPTSVKTGDDAPFTVTVTFDNKPYPSADLDKVSYTLLGADGSVVSSGEATMSQEGQYAIDITPDITGKLAAGSASLSVAVSSKVVALPTFATYQFVVTQ